MRVNYKDHRDIPYDIAEWVKSVAGVHNVYALDLVDINSLVIANSLGSNAWIFGANVSPGSWVSYAWWLPLCARTERPVH